MRVAVECGQRWYRTSSWFPFRYSKERGHYRERPSFRKFEHGFAFGPIMFIRKGDR